MYVFILLLLKAFFAFSQNQPPTVTAQEKNALEKIATLVNERYIDENIGLKTVQYLKNNL